VIWESRAHEKSAKVVLAIVADERCDDQPCLPAPLPPPLTLAADVKGSRSDISRRSKTRDSQQNPRTAAPDARVRPVWVFLTEPGLAALLMKELKYRKIFRHKTRATKSFLRNYDMLAVPDSQISGNVAASRLALHVLTCPVFGRHKISARQLDALATAWRQASTDGFVSSVVGNAFRRQDMMRWVTNRLNERGIRMVGGKPKRPMWLIIVDESYYFCFPRHNYHEAAGRDRHAERLGMLPPVVGAAMMFAAFPKPDEIVWDPVAGSGSLLSEAAEQNPHGALIGTDIDEAAVKLASRTLQRYGNAIALRGDATSIALPRRDISLTIANLPFGKQYTTQQGNRALYGGIFQNCLAHASARWRGCFLTSDAEAFCRAVADTRGITAIPVARVRIRGVDASIWLVERSAGIS
jgi:predicted RNA methylase